MRVLLKTCGAMVLAALAVLGSTIGIGAQVAAPPAPGTPTGAPNKSQMPTTSVPKPCVLPGISQRHRSLYDRVVSAWVATFAESSLQWDNPAEWYFEVAKFLEFYKGEYLHSKSPAGAISVLKSSANSSLHALGVLAEFLQ